MRTTPEKKSVVVLVEDVGSAFLITNSNPKSSRIYQLLVPTFPLKTHPTNLSFYHLIYHDLCRICPFSSVLTTQSLMVTRGGSMPLHCRSLPTGRSRKSDRPAAPLRCGGEEQWGIGKCTEDDFCRDCVRRRVALDNSSQIHTKPNRSRLF